MGQAAFEEKEVGLRGIYSKPKKEKTPRWGTNPLERLETCPATQWGEGCTLPARVTWRGVTGSVGGDESNY